MKRPMIAAAILLSGVIAVIPWRTVDHRNTALPRLSSAESLARTRTEAPALPASLNEALTAVRTRVEPLDRAPASFKEATWTTYSPSSRFRAYYAPGGAQLVSADPKAPWQWTQRLTGYGYGTTLDTPLASAPVITANRLDYARSRGLTEWFRNDSRGLEHGFTVSEAPPQKDAGPLTVTMALETGLTPQLNAAADSLAFTNAEGKTVLHYSELKSWDATGRVLPSRIEPRAHGEWALLVDDAGAQYPVTIDPLIYIQTEVTAPDGNPGDEFGAAVAISGNTAVVGAQVAEVDLEIPGAAYVFVRDGLGGWNFQAKLVADDVLAMLFGFSVDIDGDTVVVGSVYDNQDHAVAYGAAYVYTRTGTTWTKKAKLTASDGVQGDYLGFSVAISGNTIVAGTDGYGAYVFVKPLTGWATGTEAAQLYPSGGDLRRFGRAVGIDGDTIVVGDEDADADVTTFTGAVFVFEKPGGGWTGTLNETAKLTATGGASGDAFGTSLGISGDTVIVGAPQVDVDSLTWSGAAYVFVRDGSDWLQEDTLISSTVAAQNYFGRSVDISGDTAIVGEPINGGGNCAAHVFTRSEGAWSEQARLTPPALVGTPFTGSTDYGIAVGVDGQLLVIGSPDVFINGQNQPGRAYLNETDNDGDGIPDGSDVDLIEDAVTDLPLSAFKNSATGNRNAFLTNLENIESDIAKGKLNTACTKLHSLRTRVDGCGNAADNNDWIIDCAAQAVVRDYIDQLSANLGCP